MHTPRLPVLDTLRGLVALLVALFHPESIARLEPGQRVRWVGAYGGLAVPLFFALSAFSPATGYTQRLSTHEDLRSFFLQRIFRIAPLFYACIFLYWILHHSHEIGGFGLATLLLNVSFLFVLTPGHYESVVWAGWSLGVEMLMYLAFPFLLLMCRTLWQTLFALAAALVAGHYGFMSMVGQGYLEHGYASKSFVFNLPYFLFGFVAW